MLVGVDSCVRADRSPASVCSPEKRCASPRFLLVRGTPASYPNHPGAATMRLTEAPVLPPLPPQEYVQLRDSIRERGVLQTFLITADHVLIDEG